MRWRLADRFDPTGAAIADRHYPRQTVGSPQFVKPGRCLVLVTPDSSKDQGVLWVTSWPEFAGHEWAGAWECAVFRNEMPDVYLSSELILEAVAATRWKFGEPPPLGMVTFVNPDEVRKKRDPGRCFIRAGFVFVGTTKVRKRLAFQLVPERMPEPHEPLWADRVLV